MAEERTNRYRKEKDGAAMADWPDTAVDIPGSAASIQANENWSSSSASQSNDIYLIIAGNMQAAEPPCCDRSSANSPSQEGAQGLKAPFFVGPFSARLKPRPDTNLFAWVSLALIHAFSRQGAKRSPIRTVVGGKLSLSKRTMRCARTVMVFATSLVASRPALIPERRGREETYAS